MDNKGLKQLRQAHKGKKTIFDLGIKYNHHRVKHFIRFDRFDEYAKLLENDLIKNGRTLLYLASGIEQIERYDNLQYDNIILVDYMFKEYKCSIMPDGKKIISLNLDAFVAIQTLLMINHQIDAVVEINTGFIHGGANYCLAGYALGLLFPILTEDVLIITSRKYYQNCAMYNISSKKTWLNLPFAEKKTLKPVDLNNYDADDEKYLNPDLFTLYDFCKGISEVVLLKKKVRNIHTFKQGELNIHVIHSSIFSHLDKIDAGVMLFENGFQEEIIRNKTPYILNGKATYSSIKWSGENISKETIYDMTDIDQLNMLCQDFKLNSIGITPIGCDYLELINRLSVMENDLENVYFFHLNHGDYKSLYNMQ
ncbi:hypothetical protein [Parabacteroides sp. FAFU027]|uniref:hypothetical protein n=1 Tax=Parabacteroides sp. FAFU027 TaxID=2922715 RepID=UPI001FAFD113|nr:hypothetical protein [Parabacteroides sp. FAFU027]